MFKCDKCGKQIKYSSNFYRHKKHCGIKKQEECKICNLKFDNHSELMIHRNKEHIDFNKKDNFICHICNREFYTSKGTFTNHIKSHDEQWKSKKDVNIKNAKIQQFNDEIKGKELRDKISSYKKGQTHSEETKQKISNSMKNYIENLSEDEYSKFVMNYINAPLRGTDTNHSKKYEPTKIEQMIIDLNIPNLIYNGNKENAIAIRYKKQNYRKTSVPDFIYEGTNKLIEVFGIYWHPKEDEELYMNAAKENNYELLILWEDDLINNFENCKQLICQFLQNKES